MSQERNIDIEGVGRVLLKKRRGTRHLNIRVIPFKGVKVTVPYMFSFMEAERVVRSKRGWMKKQLLKMGSVENEYNSNAKNVICLEDSEARKMLVRRACELAVQYQFRFNRISVRHQKSQWGSCTAANNLILNIKLAGLPEKFVDYVILHELIHTRIKSHGKVFWDMLERYVPDARDIDAALGKYHLGII